MNRLIFVDRQFAYYYITRVNPQIHAEIQQVVVWVDVSTGQYHVCP
jgi:hypothetical protein